MSAQVSVMFYLPLLTTFVTVAMMMWIAPRFFQNYRARLYFILLLTVFLYTFSQAQEVLLTEVSGFMFWLKFQYMGVSFIPFALFALSYHSCFKKENEPLEFWTVFLLLPGTAVALAVMGAPGIEWFYTDMELYIGDRGILQLSAGRGFLFPVHIAQVVTSLIAAVVFYSIAIRKSDGRRRRSLYLLILGILTIIAVYVASLFGAFPPIIDPISIILALVSPIFAAAFYSDRLMSDIREAKLSYFDISSSPVFIFNRDRQLIDLNMAASTAFSLSRRSAINSTWFDLLADMGEGEIEIIDNEQGIGKELTVNGRTFSYTSTIFRDDRGQVRGMLRSLYDVTDIKRALKVLEQEASIDPLTGLLTRGRWMQFTARVISQGERFGHSGSLLVLDLDHFKEINDTYGHQAGDAVLREVAGRIRDSLRNIDIIGRYGGEEIVIWLVETQPAGAKIVAEKIRRRVADQPLLYDQTPISVTASIGLYGVEKIQVNDVNHYFALADKAVFEAKNRGRNRVIDADTLNTYNGG